MRKSKRLDYHENEPKVQGYRYEGMTYCTINLFDSRGNIEATRNWSRAELVAAWQLMFDMFRDWPVDGNTEP